METVNIHEAKTKLSKLLENLKKEGEPFIIAKAGKPIARVTGIDAPEADKTRRLGFLKGQIEIPEDFDSMGEAEILARFGLDEDDAPAS